MGKAEREKGNRWERTVVKTLCKLFPQVTTSRNESRTMDARQIDLVNTGNLAIQCKNYKSMPAPKTIFDAMDTGRIKVIALKHNRYMGKEGEYAILRWEDFVRIIEDVGIVYESKPPKVFKNWL